MLQLFGLTNPFHYPLRTYPMHPSVFPPMTPAHSGPGRAQNWTKTKISIYQNIIFLWAKSKDHYIGHHVSEFV